MTEDNNTRKPHNYWEEATPAQREEWVKRMQREEEESAKLSAEMKEAKRMEEISNNQDIYRRIAKAKLTIDNGNGDAREEQERGNGKDKGKKDNTVKTHSVYKYSKDIPLAEEIMLGYKSTFLQIVNDEPVTRDVLDFSKDRNFILKPHEPTNQVVIPYIFKDIEEVKSFIKLAKEKSIYDLFLMSESIWKQLLVAKNEHVITFFSTDTVYSYFQDLFPTTHYDMIIGIPGAGKGAILVSFKLQGYRAVTAAGMTGASLLELLGSVEACQVTVLEDEYRTWIMIHTRK